MKIIRSTEPSQQGISVVNDMDLCVLGENLKTYFEYVKKVRKEYGFISEEVWRAGRSAVLKEFLQSPQLFVTTQFAAKFTFLAQRNMEAELNFFAESKAK